MYKFSYAEILEESGSLNRERERLALDQAVALLERGQTAGPGSQDMLAAVSYMQRLWGFFISDLADPHNELPDMLRANLASLGLWVMEQSDLLLNGRPCDVALLINVNRAIRDGLK